MTTTIFYNQTTMQIMAVYRNCRYGGSEWQRLGYVGAQVADGLRVSRDHKVDVIVADRVEAVSPSTNPVQPAPKPPGRDLIAEIDDLKFERDEMKARLDALERR